MTYGADDHEIFNAVQAEYEKALLNVGSGGGGTPTPTPPDAPRVLPAYLRLAAALSVLVVFVIFAVLLLVVAAKVGYELALWVWGVV